jgi:thiosulfate/3-mercaptopyruvate sulfurtransferase
MNKVLIVMDEALQTLVTLAPEVLVLEVVSDYYEEPALRQHRLSHPIPGFAQIKTEELESDLLWNLKSDEDLQKVLAKAGLSPDTPKHLLLFDNIKLACGRLESRFDASARLFSILYYYGFSKISIILDSDIHPGFPDDFAAQHTEIIQRFKSHFLASETQPSKAESIEREHWSPMHPDHFVNYETMVQMLAGKLGPYRLLDARSAEEFFGVFTGYDYVPLAGKIPTAESVINGEYQVSSTENITALLARLATTLASKGINLGDRIVWYCGTGWRASRMCALTQALGYTNVAIYDGGWNEWQQRNPEDGTEKPWGIE